MQKKEVTGLREPLNAAGNALSASLSRIGFSCRHSMPMPIAIPKGKCRILARISHKDS
jgi:hypothetical protein